MPSVEVLSGFRFWKAIKAPEVAPVGHAHPQVAQHASIRIDERSCIHHLGAGLPGVFVVTGGITRTFPSDVISTFRSYGLGCFAAGCGIVKPDISFCAPFSS